MHLYVSYQQETGYDFLSNMQAFEEGDKWSIKTGLRRVFDDDRINKEIAKQVLHLFHDWLWHWDLTRNSRRWPMQSTSVSRNQAVTQMLSTTAGNLQSAMAGRRVHNTVVLQCHALVVLRCRHMVHPLHRRSPTRPRTQGRWH